uniref:Uncharacterized protein n=1 Tax=Timema shepardi TaxID=629360 RepID=A0A7R9FZY3_TIMSH|nr:unnamed protein product [Timema shepardi]
MWFQTRRSAFSDGIVKQEPRDDGYETSGGLELRSQADNHKMMNHIHIAGSMGIKCEPLEDPYSFVDDDPTPIPQPRPPAVVLQNMPNKQGRKKKIPEGLSQHEASTLANYATEAGKKALHTKEKSQDLLEDHG